MNQIVQIRLLCNIQLYDNFYKNSEPDNTNKVTIGYSIIRSLLYLTFKIVAVVCLVLNQIFNTVANIHLLLNQID